MSRKIRILVVDDHQMFRASLRQIIESMNDMEVIAEADNGLSAIKQVQKFKPDIVIMDIRMPVVDGIDATRQIKSEYPGIKIIALSSHSDRSYVEKMLQAGASDYLSKICSRNDLIKCIYSVWSEAQSETQ
jgi:DNA-binding NarL/FixJ family response regulator